MKKFDLIITTTYNPYTLPLLTAITNHRTTEGLALVTINPELDHCNSDIYEPFKNSILEIQTPHIDNIENLTLLITNKLKEEGVKPDKTAILIDKYSSPQLTAAATLATAELKPQFIKNSDLDIRKISTELILKLSDIQQKHIIQPQIKNPKIAASILENQHRKEFKECWDNYWLGDSSARQLINALSGGETDKEIRNFATGGWLTTIGFYKLQLLQKANPKRIKNIICLEKTSPQIDTIITTTEDTLITITFIHGDWEFETLENICKKAEEMRNAKAVIFANFGFGEVIEGLEQLLYSKDFTNQELWDLEGINDIENIAKSWFADN